MTSTERQSHWQNVYLNKGEQQVSWTQFDPQPSLGLIEKFARDRNSDIVDIGGGASRPVDALLAHGYTAITVLDISEAALKSASTRLGEQGEAVRWIAGDVTFWRPPRSFEVWHDRAAFHFLVEAEDREAYIDRLHAGVKRGGYAIIATFASDGPEKCSGLPVQRYDPESMAKTIGEAFELVENLRHRHVTPWGAEQSIQ